MAMPSKRKVHWIKALSTVINLRKSGGLVENDVLEGLKITLYPPASPAAASAGTLNRIRCCMSREDRPTIRKEHIEFTRENARSPIAAGEWNCEFLLQEYENVHDPRNTGGYYVDE